MCSCNPLRHYICDYHKRIKGDHEYRLIERLCHPTDPMNPLDNVQLDVFEANQSFIGEFASNFIAWGRNI